MINQKVKTNNNENMEDQIMNQENEVLRNENEEMKEQLTPVEGDATEEELMDQDNDENESNDNKSDNDEDDYTEHEDKNDQEVFETLDDLIKYYKEKYQSDSWKYLNWWKSIPNKNKYKAGDLVYIAGEKKFGVFLEPARKEGLIRVANLKKNKPEIYTRPWYYELHEIQLVKRRDKIIKGFLQVQNSLYKIEV